MTESNDDFRPAWLDYWHAPVHGPWSAAHPNWREAEHEHGVSFQAPWEDPWAGFPEHARRCAIALAATRLPVHLRSLRGSAQMQEKEDKETIMARFQLRKALSPLLDASVKYHDAEIFQVVATADNFFRLAGPTHHWLEPKHYLASLQFRIISTVFERDRISTSERECLGRVGQVWVANRKDRSMLLEHGLDEDRVGLVPIPFFPSDPHLKLNGKKRRRGATRFYHIGKWEPRKEQRNIIGAFLLAFRPGQAKLYIKTSAYGPRLKSGYPESVGQATIAWLADPRVKAMGWRSVDDVNRDVKILDKRVTPRQIYEWHQYHDVYVTLSRGEGFDMPAYDAMLSGNRLVYTHSGGPQDFARPDDFGIEMTGSVPCDPFYRWGDAHYGAYDLEQAVEQLRAADRECQQHQPDKRQLPAYAEQQFSANVVGSRMRDLVERLRDRTERLGLAITSKDEA